MGKGFASPTQFRGDDIKNALIRNWRQLVTFLNTWAVTYDADALTLTLPGDVSIGGDLTITGTYAHTHEAGSVTVSYGAMYISTPAATTISSAGTFYKAAGTTTIGTNVSEFTMPANNRLTYGGTSTKVFAVTFIGSGQTGAAYNQMAFQIAKNGTVIAESEGQTGQTASATPGIGGGAQALVSLASTDYVEIWVTNKSATNAVTVDGSLMAVEVDTP